MSSAGGEAILPSNLQHQPPAESGVGGTMEPVQRQGVTSLPNPTELQPQEEKKTGTFANQDSLPKLPIPDLESTCQKYIESLAPLQTLREHDDTRASVQDFLKVDGPELQEKLKKYASSKTSYIEQFCKLTRFNRDKQLIIRV